MSAPPPPEPIQRIARLAPLRDVEARIDAIAAPVTPQHQDLDGALGRVLATDVVANAPLPAAAVALLDGWAVRADLVLDAGPYAPMPLVPAPPWVEVGAPLPEGADAVLAPDAIVTTAGMAEVHASATPGDGVLPAGADADTGVPLRRAGTRLRAIDVAVLRAAAVTRVSVRMPRVRVVLTKRATDDIVGPLIVRGVERAGGEAQLAPAFGERALEEALRDASSDAVITIGGTGAGREDASIRTLARIGRLEMHGIGIRPGETAALGTVASRPVLMLPGRLDAALAAWLVLGTRLMARLTGHAGEELGSTARLARKVTSTIGLGEVVPVAYAREGVEPLASGYFPLQVLTRAEGWILVAPESEGLPAGAMVEVKSFP